MAVTLLIDAHLDGHAELLAMRLNTEAWRELATHLDIRFLHLEQAGLDRNVTDDIVWQWCQHKGC
jgi:hypothetical protein